MSVPITRPKKDRRHQSSKQDDPSSYPVQAVQATGDQIGEIYGHSAVVWQDSMYIFGGCNQKSAFSSDLYRFNFSTKMWNIVETSGKKPGGRHFHASCIIGDSMYIFGGKSNGYMNDLFVLDLETLTWTCEDNISGKPPTKRYGHTAVVFNKKMYIFGGYDDFGYKSNELWEYRPDSREWRRIETEGDIPERFHHSAVLHNGSMFVFGGLVGGNAASNNTITSANWLFEYRFSTRRWSRVQAVGKLPEGRWGHSSAIVGSKLFIIGGCDNVLSFKDIHKLDLIKLKWTKIPNSGLEARYFNSCVEYQDKVYIFAGRNIHNYCFNDVCVFTPDAWRDRRPDTFFSDLLGLLDDKEFSDIVFEFPDEGNMQIHAHKAILTARCSNFQAMLRSGMKESVEQKIVIKDVKYSTYRSFLHYIYTSMLPKLHTVDDYLDLLQLADRYMLAHLKSLCERSIKKYITISNLNALWEAAQQLHAEELQQFCVKAAVKYYDGISDKKSINKSLMTIVKEYISE